MTSIKWSAHAREDLAHIDDYYHREDPEFATHIGREAIRAARFLLSSPEAGPRIGWRDWRKWAVPGTSYVLLYRREGSVIHIQRVRHNRENWRPKP